MLYPTPGSISKQPESEPKESPVPYKDTLHADSCESRVGIDFGEFLFKVMLRGIVNKANDSIFNHGKCNGPMICLV
jgi:hypothetical protein